jgi:O-antigen/teichoic acid export membrane protein
MALRFIISITLGIFVTTYIIRSLPVMDYGVYNILYSMIVYISVISSMGIPAVMQRYIPEAFQQKDYGLVKTIIIQGGLLRFFFSLVTIGIILLFNEPIGQLLKLDNFFSYFSIFSIGIIFYIESQVLNHVLNSLFLHKYNVISSTLYTLTRGLVIFIVFKSNSGVYGLIVAEVIAWAAWTAYQSYFYYKNFVLLHKTTPKSSIPVKRYFRYGGFSLFSDIGSTALGTSTDFLIITAFLGPEAVALYAFSDRLIKMLVRCLPHMVLKDVIRPVFFTKYSQNNDQKHLEGMFNMLLKIAAFGVLPLIVALIVLGEKIIAIVFKAEYLQSMPFLTALGIFTMLDIFFQPLGLTIKALEKVEYSFYSKIFAIYNIIGALVVVQYFGVMGVILVTCSAVLMKNMYLFYAIRLYVSLKIDWKGLATIGINTTVMAAGLLLLASYVNDLLSLMVVSIAGSLIYLLLSFVNKAFWPNERKILNNLLPKPIFVF